MPSVSLYLEYGGDLQRSPQGGLLLARDTSSEATSTLQRLERLLLTNPRIRDSYNNVVARGDSMFYPDYGAGIPSFVDANLTSQLLQQLQATILYQITQDPGISRNPAPVISVTGDRVANLNVSVTVYTVSGQIVTTPAYNLSSGGSS